MNHQFDVNGKQNSLGIYKKMSKQKPITPPKRSKNTLTDILYFFLRKPKAKTLIRFRTKAQRENYNHRVLQRFGIKPDDYSVLNIHQIGVDTPVSYMFNELLQWDGNSTCWPNHIAKVDRVDNKLEDIQILLFGRTKHPLGLNKILERTKLIPLFKLKARNFKKTPDGFDFDNARYLLYDCSGGYPIGFFVMYVRSPIADMGEVLPSQLFFIVGFNFFGRNNFDPMRLIHKVWQGVHNRVTTHVLNRMKQLGEWRLEHIREKYKNHEG